MTQEQIEQAAFKEIPAGTRHTLLKRKAFISGANFVLGNQWVSVENKPIPIGPYVLAYNPKWVDEDFNQQGVRIGFMTEDGFTSAYWWDSQDDFISIAKLKWDGDENNMKFYENHLDNSEPTHWMSIPSLKGGEE